VSDGVGSKVELAKVTSDHLRGSIAEELRQPNAAFSGSSYLLLKFHGTYQQDNRDTRSDRKRRGLDVEHMCMVRVSVPGGVLTAEQYLALDRLCDVVGNGTLRVTSRQGIQFHFVAKEDLPLLIGTLNDHLLTTFGACGDVARNTICCPAPIGGRARGEVSDRVQEVARHFRPASRAYYEIWADDERIVTAEMPDEEPFYGDAYLPRKFKIGFAAPDENCIDVYANDVGLIPIIEDDVLQAFTVVVGGGMGKSHSNPATFPRLADPLTTVAPAELIDVLEAIVELHRDHGDRADRDHARLKYLVEDWGIDRVRTHLGRRLGRTLSPPEPFTFAEADDHLGWHRQHDGRWFLGTKVDNGRIGDTDAVRMRSALREAITRFRPGVRLTTREDVLLTDLRDADRAELDELLQRHGVIPAEEWVPIRRNSFACPALPTCGLALAESERVMPQLLADLDDALGAIGLSDLDVHVRMTGCPNGCARPYTTEIGIVGRGKNRYDVLLGGETIGTRLNQTFCENVPLPELVRVLVPVLDRFRGERRHDERFGNYCHRVGVERLRAELGTEEWVRTPRSAAPPLTK
jgi:sulfite reductase (ferredoxin)